MSGFKIIKSEEALEIRNIFTVLFGLPGVGKTSLSFTFPKPVLHFDFDKGLNRAVQTLRPDSFSIDNYGEFQDYIMSDEFETFIKDNGYQSVSVDTIGTMLDDYIAPWLIQQNPKNGMGGGLSLQGWGQLGNAFNLFKSRLQRLNLEIIAICHGKEEGEDRQYRLAVKGGSTDIIYRSSDMIGFVTIQGKNRFVDFNPTQSHIGKNTARLEMIAIPDADKKFDDYCVLGETIVTVCKEKMVEASNAQLAAKKIIDEYKESLNQASKPADFDSIIEGLIEEPNKTIKVQVKKHLGEALKEKGLQYDKDLEKVVKIPKEAKKAKESTEEPAQESEPQKEEANANA